VLGVAIDSLLLVADLAAAHQLTEVMDKIVARTCKLTVPPPSRPLPPSPTCQSCTYPAVPQPLLSISYFFATRCRGF
jgi:hypothetical protein